MLGKLSGSLFTNIGKDAVQIHCVATAWLKDSSLSLSLAFSTFFCFPPPIFTKYIFVSMEKERSCAHLNFTPLGIYHKGIGNIQVPRISWSQGTKSYCSSLQTELRARERFLGKMNPQHKCVLNSKGWLMWSIKWKKIKLTEVKRCPSMSASILQANMIEAGYSSTKSKSILWRFCVFQGLMHIGRDCVAIFQWGKPKERKKRAQYTSDKTYWLVWATFGWPCFRCPG